MAEKENSDMSLLGAAATRQITKTLEGALDSPTKELGNYIADKIRYLRYGSLLKIVERADRKARERGLNLKMPTLKFFVPFCEAASLEAADDEPKICEMWANLLTQAAGTDEAQNLLFMRCFSRLAHVRLAFLPT